MNRATFQMDMGWNGASSRAVDGNGDGSYWSHSCTHTLNHPEAWWAVDLGEETEITSVSISNRADCCCKCKTMYTFLSLIYTRPDVTHRLISVFIYRLSSIGQLTCFGHLCSFWRRVDDLENSTFKFTPVLLFTPGIQNTICWLTQSHLIDEIRYAFKPRSLCFMLCHNIRQNYFIFVCLCGVSWKSPLRGDEVSMLTHTYPHKPWEILKWPYMQKPR